jgi:hypothetical protein
LRPICLGSGFFMIGWSQEKKGSHDMICGTRVACGKLQRGSCGKLPRPRDLRLPQPRTSPVWHDVDAVERFRPSLARVRWAVQPGAQAR